LGSNNGRNRKNLQLARIGIKLAKLPDAFGLIKNTGNQENPVPAFLPSLFNHKNDSSFPAFLIQS